MVKENENEELIKNPLLTVACITYNHADYIATALDSFISQKTSFPYIVLVADDGSTDGTNEIIKEYASKYPDIIKPILHPINIGAWNNVVSLYKEINTPYVALCEGDDYWIDNNKLQEQVEFLEENKDFSTCFHNAIVRWENGEKPDSIFPAPELRFYKTVLTLDNLLVSENFMQTNTIVYRWALTEEMIDKIPKDIVPQDLFVSLLHARYGKLKFINKEMSVYRKHSTGIWQGAGQSPQWLLRHALAHVRFFQELENHFGGNFFLRKSNLIRHIIMSLNREKDLDIKRSFQSLLEQIREIEPDIVKLIESGTESESYQDISDTFAVIKNCIKYSILSYITFGRYREMYRSERKKHYIFLKSKL